MMVVVKPMTDLTPLPIVKIEWKQFPLSPGDFFIAMWGFWLKSDVIPQVFHKDDALFVSRRVAAHRAEGL
jgi:hypothetical protein